MPINKAIAYVIILSSLLITYQLVFAPSYSYESATFGPTTNYGSTEDAQFFDSGTVSAYEYGDPAVAFWAFIILFVSFLTALGFYINICILIAIGTFLLMILSLLGFISFGVPVYLLALVAIIGSIAMSISDNRKQKKAMRDYWQQNL